MKKCFALFLLLFISGYLGFSQQGFFVQNEKRSDKVKFKLLNNLIVVPVEINGVKLPFILDTGVSRPIVFNFLKLSDTLKIKKTESISLRGLGEGEAVKALKSRGNILKIGDAVNLNQDLYAVQDLNLNFGPRLGTPIYGIIGFDVFKDLIVEINYRAKYLRFTNPDAYTYKNCKNCELFHLEFYNNKPYINVDVGVNKKRVRVKLLIDSGGSDSLWLFENDSLGIVSGDKFFNDFLGHGLSGSVYGKRSKIESLFLNSFELKQANVAYPDSTSIPLTSSIKKRNGSLSGNILKRFNIIMDYRSAMMILKRNKNFNEPFSYNKSGIELAHNGVRIIKEIQVRHHKTLDREAREDISLNTNYKFTLKPSYEIVELRSGSPAEKSGLMIGDVILSINNKPAYRYTLQELMYMFYDDDGKRIELKIQRRDSVLKHVFFLEALF